MKDRDIRLDMDNKPGVYVSKFEKHELEDGFESAKSVSYRLPNLNVYRQKNDTSVYECINKLYNDDDSSDDLNLYYRNIEYLSPNKNDVSVKHVNLIVENNNDNVNINNPQFKYFSSGDVAVSAISPLYNNKELDLDDDLKYHNINFVTINGKSVIVPPTRSISSNTRGWISKVSGSAYSRSNSDISLATPDDINSSTSRIKFKNVSSEAVLLSFEYYNNIADYNNPRTKEMHKRCHDVSVSFHDSIKINNSGDLFANRFFQNSDERLKTNIGDVEFTDYLPEIKQFNWIDSSVKSYGYIAQEVEAYYPELVYETSDGTKKVDYSAAHSLVIAGLQADNHQLHLELNEVKQENQELKSRLDALEAMIQKLI